MNKPYNYAELNTLVTKMIPYLEANASRLSLHTEDMNTLKDIETRWAVAYPIHLDTGNRSHNQVKEFELLAKEANTAIRKTQQYLKVAFADQLINEDYVVCGIHIDKDSKESAKIPTDTLILKIIKQLTALFRIEASFIELPDGNHRTVLDGKQNKEILVTYVIQDPELPAPMDKDFIITKTFTHSVFDLVFDQDDIGKMVYIKACLRNTRGQEGPFGKVISAIISS